MRKLFRPRTPLTTSSGMSCTPAEPDPIPVRASGSWQSCPACGGTTSGSCRTCAGAGVVFAPQPAPSGPAAVPARGPVPDTGLPEGPSMVCAHPDTPPLTAALRFRVWRQPYGHVDHVSDAGDDLFCVQTATLAEAVQVERLLEAYDAWQDRDGDHDIDSWDGTTWRPGLDSVEAATAQEFLQTVEDITAGAPGGTDRRTDA